MSASGTPRRGGKGPQKSAKGGATNLSSRGLVPHAEVTLLYNESDDRQRIAVATATLFGTVEGELAYMNHNHDVRKFQSRGHDVVLVWKVNVEQGKENHLYPYKMPPSDEQPAPRCLKDMQRGFRYAWDVNMMEVKGAEGVQLSAAGQDAILPVDQRRTPQSKSGESPTLTPRRSQRLAQAQKGTPASTTPPATASSGNPPNKRTASQPLLSDRRVRRRIPFGEEEAEKDSPTAAGPSDPTRPTPAPEPEIRSSDLDSGDEGAPEPSPPVPASLRMHTVDMSEYKKDPVLVNVNDIKFMEHTVRDTEDQHVEALVKAIGEQGTLSSAGNITVTVMDRDELAKLGSNLSGQRLQVECVGVDGRHRTLAYRRLQDQASSQQQRDEFTWILAQLYTRHDGQPMSELEVIAVGAHLNNVSSTVRKSTFADNVHNAMSCAALVQKQMNLPVEKVDPGVIATVMADIDSIPGLSRTQYARYARLAHAFTRNKIKASVLKEYSNVGVVHVTHKEYLKLDRPGMLLGLESVSAYIKAPAPRGTTKGPFEQTADEFYDAMREMYAQARACANQHQVPVTDLLEKDVAITKHQHKKLRHVIRNSLSSFSKKGGDKMLKAQRARLAMLRKYVDTHYASKVSRPAAASAPEPEDVQVRRTDRSTAGHPPERMRVASPARRPAPARKVPRHVPRQVVTPTSPPRKKIGGAKVPRVRETPDRVRGVKRAGAPQKSPETPTGRREAQEAINLFDDNLPQLLPVGLNDPPAWDGPSRPMWVNYATEVPSKWPSRNPIEHPSPWLHSLCIPPQHRAHYSCTVDDLLAIHRAVYYHAAKARHAEIGSTVRPMLGTETLPRTRNTGASSRPHTREEALWAAAVERDELALQYFGQRKGEIDSRGYCILEGFCSDKNVPSLDAFPRLDPDGDVLENMVLYFESTFPGEDALRDERNRVRWNPIVNTIDTDTPDRRKGTGRFITTMEGVCSHLEQEASKTWVVVKRAQFDARLGQIIAALGLVGHDPTVSGVDLMSIPKSGGRFLLTGKGCPRQILHTDFGVEDDRELSRVPGYFLICTSGAETPLWIVDNSHFYLQQSSGLWPYLSKGLVARKVIIPPYSILIGRGDLQHAGAADIDHPNPPVRGCLRYHIYFVPHDRKLVDGVHFTTGLTPDFVDEVPEAEEETVEEEVEVEVEEEEEVEEDDGNESSGEGNSGEDESGSSSE